MPDNNVPVPDYFIILFVLARDYRLPPGAVIEIPAYRFHDTVRELRFGQPAEFRMYLRRVDRVAHVVPLAVGYKRDEALGLAQLFADEFYDVYVPHLVMPADVVYLALSAFSKYEVYRAAVILDVQPVAHVLALAVDGQRLIRQRVQDHKRDELLGEMVRTVIVRAAAYRDGKPVSAMVREHKEIRSRLGARIRAGRMQRSALGKEQVGAVERQVAVHFVRRYLMVPLYAVLAAGVHERRRTYDVGLQKDAGIFDTAVDVALRREIDHDIRLFLGEQPIHALAVADIQPHKAEIRIVHNAFESGKIACVSEFVNADYAVTRMSLHHMEDEVAADESRAAGNKYRFRRLTHLV